eukprot:c27141_g1_i1 orf=375-1331(+)
MGLFTGFTRLCKGLAAVLVAGYLITLIFPFIIDYLALIPGKTIPFAWNLLTAGYLEQSFLELLVSVLGLLFGGKLLEPIWGSREFLKFIVAVNFLTSLSTFIFMILLYYVSRQEDYLYIPLSGFHGILAGFLVAVKQIMPDQEVTASFVLKLRAKWLSSFLVLIAIVLGLLIKESILFVPFILLGTYCSWVYLRYFQRKSETNLRGDLSDEFSFATFFPEFLRPVVNAIALICEKLFCWRNLKSREQAEGQFLGGLPLPGSDPIEATRRRERGARALEERLSVAAKSAELESRDKGSKGKPDFLLSNVNQDLGAEDNV